jgi:hypothetical protein
VTIAVPVPPGPVALTVAVPEDGIDVGAVYKPEDVTEPEVALHVVALLAENCCVPPSTTVTVAGKTVSFDTSVTIAVPFPPGPIAVMVSVPVAVVVAGAV